MKRKLKFVSLAISMVMCLSLMVLGVYAATTASFKVTNNVSFAIQDQINCDVTYGIAGALTEQNKTDATLVSFANGGTTEKSNVATNGTDLTKALGALEFGEGYDTDTKVITLTFNFANTGDETIYLTWTAPGATCVNVTVGGDLAAASASAVEISVDANVDVELTYTVDDTMADAATASIDSLTFTLALAA